MGKMVHGEVLKGLDFGEIWPHSFNSENCTCLEGNLGLPDLTLQAVEDNACVVWLSS